MPEKKLPIECRARYNAILQIGDELLETFINGNRNTMLAELEELEPRTALAVLSRMMRIASKENREAIGIYLLERA